MGWKALVTFMSVVIVIVLLVVYWFIPIGQIDFTTKSSGSSNFSLGDTDSMQFYPNMRFPSSDISYKIYECTLKKQNDMEDAFEIISDKTPLNFVEMGDSEDISITCSEDVKMEEGLFIAGEGGPTQIIQTDLFSVILHGKILLIKDSKCANPNVAIHELLHVLGFDHSENGKNIMYYMSSCGQTIGDDTIEAINKLYEAETYPDLTFKNVSASVKSTYLDAEINVKNNGLAVSVPAEIDLYADDKLVRSFNLKGLEIGSGVKMTLENVWMSKRNPEELKFVIDYDYTEIDKTNNEVVLSGL